ncbi:uncharacterized protein VDAG_04889 [Verticillium dahliae VdLs.17]|uniref:Uncharacterized protein n=1 Tax=Verticillium dahliae (strain VdLs.17 / ATCC MYA-4575 / FGSC 10137) TaxID=498257 RepID=G2X3A4_VERDV|nr:uncharacterized protein VDAG_04889 [Verticillium dahliae VdLs.17]EGY23451.1 hypothetical protein VDAG_04889 [Verticillium dahliae VdLs.17]KAH6708542.1 hypothetical protein EV126DRAFT_438833 [Verticillium dahliae]
MHNDRGHRYDVAPIPSYDEAIAGGGPANWTPPSPADDRDQSETQSLLFSHPHESSSLAVALIIARVVAITIVMGFLYIVFVSDDFNTMAHRLGAFQRAVMSRPTHQSMAKVVRSCPASAINSDIPDHAMDIRGFYLKTQPPPYAELGACSAPERLAGCGSGRTIDWCTISGVLELSHGCSSLFRHGSKN